MAWRPSDYNLQYMSRKSDATIEKEFARLANKVSARYQTFVSHNKMTKLMQSAFDSGMLASLDGGRRAKEHAIIDMKHFLSLNQSSYTGYVRTMRTTIEYWTNMGIKGLNMSNIDQFLDFLEWSRSFYGYTYNAPEMIETWNTKVKTGDLDGLIEFFSEKISGGISNP